MQQKVHFTKFSGHKDTTPGHHDASWSEQLFDSLDHKHLKRCEKMVISKNREILQEIELNKCKAEYIIGHDPLADIQLESAKVSKFHALLSCRDGRFFIQDLNSENGTYFNGVRLKQHETREIRDGNRARIMGFEFDFYLNPQFEDDKNPNKSFSGIEGLQPLKNKPSQPCPLLSHLVENGKQNKIWKEGTRELVVVDIVEETHNVKTFRLSGKMPIVFSYRPGQFITLILPINGQQVRRSYSMSSSPSRPYTLDITVKRVQNGLVSNWLCDELKTGDTLKVKDPSGKFSCFYHPSEKLLLIGAGSGITPIMSMLRWVADSGAAVDTRVLASFHSLKDIIFRKELESMAFRSGNIKIGIAVSKVQKNKGKWSGLTGRITKQKLLRYAQDIKERHVYLCGPEDFMECIKAMLKEIKFPLDNLYCESFATEHSPLNTDYEQLRKRVAQDAKYELNFVKAGKTVPANDDFSLLELAEMNGIEMDYSCRTGHCGECMVKSLAGNIEMSDQAEIDEKDKNNRWVYGCCAYPRSDVLLDL